MSTANSQAREDLLETQLLTLGRQEIEIERKLLLLRLRGREAAQAHRFEEADSLWALHAEAKAELAVLQSEISSVEMTLYAMRRKRQKSSN